MKRCFVAGCLLLSLIVNGQKIQPLKQHLNSMQTKVKLSSVSNLSASTQILKERLDSNLYFRDRLSDLALAKETFLYDAKGRNNYSSWEERDTLNMSWVIEMQTYYAYDSMDRLVSEECHESYDKQVPEPSCKITYAYSETNKLDSVINYYYSNNNNDWTKSTMDQYEYKNDTLIRKCEYSWDRDVNIWVQCKKTDYFQSDTGRYGIMIMKDFDVNMDGLVTKEDWQKTISIYDENSNLLNVQNMFWQSESNDWYVFREIEYTYNSDNLNVTTKSYHFEGAANQKVLDWDDAYIYDENGNTIDYIFREKEEQTEGWYQSKTSYRYDLTCMAEDYNLPYLDWMRIVNKPIEIIGYAHQNDEWVEQYVAYCYYSDNVTTPINNTTSEIRLMVYNHAMECNFQNSHRTAIVKLFDINGKLVLTRSISDDAIINLNHLGDGIYIYQIASPDFISTGKIILQN